MSFGIERNDSTTYYSKSLYEELKGSIDSLLKGWKKVRVNKLFIKNSSQFGTKSGILILSFVLSVPGSRVL